MVSGLLQNFKDGSQYWVSNSRRGKLKINSGKGMYTLRADVRKYRPEVYKSEKLKILKKIHKVALGKVLTEM